MKINLSLPLLQKLIVPNIKASAKDKVSADIQQSCFSVTALRLKITEEEGKWLKTDILFVNLLTFLSLFVSNLLFNITVGSFTQDIPRIERLRSLNEKR